MSNKVSLLLITLCLPNELVSPVAAQLSLRETSTCCLEPIDYSFFALIHHDIDGISGILVSQHSNNLPSATKNGRLRKPFDAVPHVLTRRYY
jgi:hypothetical protein